MLTHWIWLTVECNAPTSVCSAIETIVVSRTAATPPMINAVSTRLVSGGSAVVTCGGAAADASGGVVVLLITTPQ